MAMVTKYKLRGLLLSAAVVNIGLLVAGGLAVGLHAQAPSPGGQTKAGAAATGSADRPADRAAIREALKSFVAAFEKGDAAAAAGLMTTGAELMAPDGT